jgi:hypothetical protein
LRTKLKEIGVDTGPSTTFVVPIMIGSDRELMYDLCRQMRRRGLFLPPIDYPVVPEDQLRFRASVTAMHAREDLDEALNIIEDWRMVSDASFSCHRSDIAACQARRITARAKRGCTDSVLRWRHDCQ